jgi:tetratricopeptide (TPR) repeat protein
VILRAVRVHRPLAVAIAAVTLCLAMTSGAATTPASAPKPAAKPAGDAKTGATTAKPRAATATRRSAATTKSLLELARETREIEDTGAYSRAVSGLRAMRPRVIADADLELFLALDEARAGLVDSAWVRLHTPLMNDAVEDTLPLARRVEYPYRREGAWLNGHYDGWPWYIWRARAELAALRGRWPEAYEAARQCVEARPMTGKEWLILAVAAGRTQKADESRSAAERAALLDPTLPEAHYLVGLWEWKAGRRAEAQQAFRRAVSIDSAFVPAALALMRARIPGIAADSLPAELLSGRRRAALITAPEGPKPEEYVQVDVPANLAWSPDSTVADSIPAGVKPLRLVLSLLVDERGRPVIDDIPWFPVGALPEWKINRLLRNIPSWRFNPAIRLGAPHAVWISMDFEFIPTAAGAASVRKD